MDVTVERALPFLEAGADPLPGSERRHRRWDLLPVVTVK
jgi:hypothetical protein